VQIEEPEATSFRVLAMAAAVYHER